MGFCAWGSLKLQHVEPRGWVVQGGGSMASVGTMGIERGHSLPFTLPVLLGPAQRSEPGAQVLAEAAAAPALVEVAAGAGSCGVEGQAAVPVPGLPG